MSKKYKISLAVVSILLIICIGLFVVKKFIYDKTENKKPTVYSSIVEKMDSYGYSLDDRDTELFKEKYYELKEVLEQEEIDYQKYAENLAQLFVIDLFTIGNKVNKYDVGGLDYLYDAEKEMFKNKVMDTLYEHVEDNSYDTRKQELPIVSNIDIDNVEETSYEINEKKKDGYQIDLNINYKKDMGYDNKCQIIVVKDDNMMYVVKYTTSNN